MLGAVACWERSHVERARMLRARTRVPCRGLLRGWWSARRPPKSRRRMRERGRGTRGARGRRDSYGRRADPTRYAVAHGRARVGGRLTGSLPRLRAMKSTRSLRARGLTPRHQRRSRSLCHVLKSRAPYTNATICTWRLETSYIRRKSRTKISRVTESSSSGTRRPRSLKVVRDSAASRALRARSPGRHAA